MQMFIRAAVVAATAGLAGADTIDFESFAAGTDLDGVSIGGLVFSGAEVVDPGTWTLDDIVESGQFAMAKGSVFSHSEISMTASGSMGGMSSFGFTLFLDDADLFDGSVFAVAEAVTVEGTFVNGVTRSFTVNAGIIDGDVFGDLNLVDDTYRFDFDAAALGSNELVSVRISDSGHRFGVDNITFSPASPPAIPLPTAGLMAAAGGLLVVRSRRR